MKAIRYSGIAVLATILCLLVVKGQAISHRPGLNQAQQGVTCTNGKSTEANPQDRRPKCCGQCTASDGKAGCTFTRSDGTTGCTSCGG